MTLSLSTTFTMDDISNTDEGSIWKNCGITEEDYDIAREVGLIDPLIYDYDIMVKPTADDDIGRLTQAFNTMIKKLKAQQLRTMQAQNKLQSSHDELEQKRQSMEIILNHIIKRLEEQVEMEKIVTVICFIPVKILH